MSFGPFTFLAPWLLTGLLALPVIWWLLRTTPPSPQRVSFPPVRILLEVLNKERTPERTPWWLMLLRMLAAALVIFSLAEPVLNARGEQAAGQGPLAIMVDNSWPAAAQWQSRTDMMGQLIDTAEANGRPILIVPTAAGVQAAPAMLSAAEAREVAAALIPLPHQPARARALERLERALAGQDAEIVWLGDGLAATGDADALTALERIAEKGAGFTMVREPEAGSLLAVAGRSGVAGRLEAVVVRVPAEKDDTGRVVALSGRGERLGSSSFSIPAGERNTELAFDMPLELRNQVVRLAIENTTTAGAVHLLDARSRWNRIGLVTGESQEQAQSLLSPLHYIERALKPFAEISKPRETNVPLAIRELLGNRVSVLALADIGKLVGTTADEVEKWVRKGGVLLRFSGPRLEQGSDDLLPVPLRQGGRAIGGALSWQEPQRLAAFDDESVFRGLTVPDDVRVQRQVLADPAQLRQTTLVWARLQDGTPLVTAERRGDGVIILFHVTANAEWSNLPLSGLFVELLRKITALSNITTTAQKADAGQDGTASVASSVEAGVLAPVSTLDGYGNVGLPPPNAKPIRADLIEAAVPGPDHPPGLYGPSGAARALNVARPDSVFEPLELTPQGGRTVFYERAASTALKSWLLAAALGLLFLDVIAIFFLQGLFSRRPGGRGARSAPVAAVLVAGLLAGLALVSPLPALAQSGSAEENTAPAARPEKVDEVDSDFALLASLRTRLAYVRTGDDETDEVSRQGLAGLGRTLTARTTIEPDDPVGVDVLSDEIAFFPILYWPVLERAETLPASALAKIDAYMKNGGMIVFDTRDYGQSFGALGSGGTGSQALQRLLAGLDLPRLEIVPAGHVLTKSFYLLNSFPGRWDGGDLWVEAGSVTVDGSQDTRRARRSDGVSSILVTANDFASAWALDFDGRPLFPVVPGGELQREMSFRTGVNIVMYALTGNYKADQVHIPDLLERLGQ